MPGLLGRKLGMTQVFDAEDGHVERVTVIEAGPCFVTAIRRAERDGYDAVQLAFGEISEKKLQKARRGHLQKAGVGNLRHLCEFRGEAGELELGAEVKVDAVFEKGETVKVSGVSKGKGFAGTIKRHNFHRGPVSHGSHNVRAPGLDRRLRRSRARVQGDPGTGPDGQQARDAARARGRGRPGGRQPAVRPRLGAGPQGQRRRDQEGRLMAAPQAPFIGKKQGKLTLDESRVRRELPRAARARGGARRAGRAPARHGVHQDARRGRHDRREGLAPEGHRAAPAWAPSRRRSAPAVA